MRKEHKKNTSRPNMKGPSIIQKMEMEAQKSEKKYSDSTL
jgi:hypothetical protein